MAALFWLSDRVWAAIEPDLPKNRPGAWRGDNGRTISGILHMLKTGFHWVYRPPAYGQWTAGCNRFNRWSRRGFWLRLLGAPADVIGRL